MRGLTAGGKYQQAKKEAADMAASLALLQISSADLVTPQSAATRMTANRDMA